MAKMRAFSAIPRNSDPGTHIDELMRVVRFGENNGLAGTLLFTGNPVPIDPWPMAQHILAHTASSSPLIAVNPIYAHPFTVAKFVSSFASLYRRKVYLNMITGTAISDLDGLSSQLSHQDRYTRLDEFIGIVRELLSSRRPLSFDGKFYATKNLQLPIELPRALMPEFLIAGQSDDARGVAARTGSLAMQMLPSNLEHGIRAPGVNLGIFARSDRQQAIREARLRFRDDPEERELLKCSMENTDSIWKRRLAENSQNGELFENGYWLLPFLVSQADCPYLVGSYDEIGTHLRRFAEMNVTTIILDVVADEDELGHVAKALACSGLF
jgi:alkanesulfonate monooxygenase